jgi:hypothetical protein
MLAFIQKLEKLLTIAATLNLTRVFFNKTASQFLALKL